MSTKTDAIHQQIVTAAATQQSLLNLGVQKMRQYNSNIDIRTDAIVVVYMTIVVIMV